MTLHRSSIHLFFAKTSVWKETSVSFTKQQLHLLLTFVCLFLVLVSPVVAQGQGGSTGGWEVTTVEEGTSVLTLGPLGIPQVTAKPNDPIAANYSEIDYWTRWGTSSSYATFTHTFRWKGGPNIPRPKKVVIKIVGSSSFDAWGINVGGFQTLDIPEGGIGITISDPQNSYQKTNNTRYEIRDVSSDTITIVVTANSYASAEVDNFFTQGRVGT
jgi:hypothetical protein